MRRLILALVLVSTVATLDSCKRKKKQVDFLDEGGGQLVSTVQTRNPGTAIQLVKGFHDIENAAWRWTMGKFTVILRPPEQAAQKGATLKFNFVLPEPILAKLKAVTISATVNGKPLEPATFNQAGPQEYKKSVPASSLIGEVITVDFTLDKFVPAGAMDLRELGVIAESIGLEVQ